MGHGKRSLDHANNGYESSLAGMSPGRVPILARSVDDAAVSELGEDSREMQGDGHDSLGAEGKKNRPGGDAAGRVAF